VKAIFLTLALASIFATAVLAQTVSTPGVTFFVHPRSNVASSGFATTPATGASTLFYGGDSNCEDPNDQGFANMNTLQIPDTETFGTVTISAGKQVVVEGMFINIYAGFSDFDPATATWEIRTGMSEGDGGTQVATGSAPIKVTPLNTCGEAIFAYTVALTLTKPQSLTAGAYWFNVTPQCTDTGNPDCSFQTYYVDNTTQGTNNIRGHLQPLHSMYLNSAFFGYSYANWCDPALGQNSHQCAALSFGVIGTHN
jgi:hypothetical protein